MYDVCMMQERMEEYDDISSENLYVKNKNFLQCLAKGYTEKAKKFYDDEVVFDYWTGTTNTRTHIRTYTHHTHIHIMVLSFRCGSDTIITKTNLNRNAILSV